MSANRETLLTPLKVKVERVPVPEFGQDEYVMCHGLTAREKNTHDSCLMKRDWSGIDRGKAITQKERLIIRCVRDDEGQKIFTDQDIDAISNWPADLLNRVFDKCSDLCGGDATEDETQSAAKNSQETQDG